MKLNAKLVTTWGEMSKNIQLSLKGIKPVFQCCKHRKTADETEKCLHLFKKYVVQSKYNTL